jgi:hypothetical protein
MTESYTFQILADVSRFAAEAGKVPGITEKQAAAATARFLAQQQAAQARAAKASEDAARREIAAADKAAAAQIAAQERTAREAEAAAERAAAAQIAAAERATAAAEKAAREQIAAQERIAREAADAADKLARLGEVGDDVAQLTRRFNDQAEEIRRLAAITGDQEAASRALAAAQRQLDADLAKVNGTAGSAADKISKVGGSAGKLAGFLSVVSPGLADAARNVGDLADGGELASEAWESFGGALKANALVLGTLGAAVVAAGLAYRAATLEISRINEQRKFEHELAQSLVPAENALRDALQAQAVATGKLSEAGLAELKVRQATQAQVSAYLTATADKINALESEIASGQKYINLQRGIAAALVIVADLTSGLGATIGRAAASGRSLSEVIADDARALNSAFDAVTGLESGADDARARIDALNTAAAQNTAALKAAQLATLDAQAALEAKGNADAAATAATEAGADAARDRLDAEQALQTFLDGLSAQRQAITDQALSDEQRLRTERDRALQEIEDNLSAQLAAEQLTASEKVAALEAARETELVIEQQYLEQRAALIAGADAAVEEQRAAARADAADAQAATQDAQIALAQQSAQSLVDLTSAIYGGMTDAGLKKGLGAAFAVSKAAALAQAGLNTALAISNALATPLPPPAPQIAAAAAAVSGGVAFATIAAQQPPTYHEGTLYADGPGSPGLGGDEFYALMQRGEVVIPSGRAAEPGMRELLGAILDGQIGPGHLASGMDRSSVPRLLSRILGALSSRGAPAPTPWQRQTRPGRRS